MAHWLLKSEPHKYSWEMMAKDGRTHWDGIRNHAAAINLKTMKVGDTAFFYHSNEGKEIVGVVEVARESYPDPTAEPGSPWVVVDLKAVGPVPKPVTLVAVKTEPKLKDMTLLKQSRLSVQPVTAEEWKVVAKMGGWK